MVTIQDLIKKLQEVSEKNPNYEVFVYHYDGCMEIPVSANSLTFPIVDGVEGIALYGGYGKEENNIK